jgi:hypothetical protein
MGAVDLSREDEAQGARLIGAVPLTKRQGSVSVPDGGSDRVGCRGDRCIRHSASRQRRSSERQLRRLCQWPGRSPRWWPRKVPTPEQGLRPPIGDLRRGPVPRASGNGIRSRRFPTLRTGLAGGAPAWSLLLGRLAVQLRERRHRRHWCATSEASNLGTTPSFRCSGTDMTDLHDFVVDRRHTPAADQRVLP